MWRGRNLSALVTYADVRENTDKSPDHPIRSLRWGQSVGIDRKLPSVDHTIFCQSLFTLGSDVSYSEVSSCTELITSPLTASTGNGLSIPVISNERYSGK